MMVTDKQVSVRQACKIVSLPRSVYRYRQKPKEDSVLIEALEELVKKHPTIVFGSVTIGFAEAGTSVIINGCTGYKSSQS
jgi:hypothetical protein